MIFYIKLCDEEVSDEIEKITKTKGLYGLGVKTKIGVVGNSLDIKINKKIADFCGLRKGEEVRLTPENKHEIKIAV